MTSPPARDRRRHPRAVRRARGGAGRRPGPSAGRPVPRHGRRRSAPPHLPDRERDRRGALPAARIHHPRLPRPHRVAGRHAAAATPIWARCSASAARAATSSFRPASRTSARPTSPRADARSMADAHALLARASCRASTLTVTLGDQRVFEAVLAALGLPRGWQKRLARAFGSRRCWTPPLTTSPIPSRNGDARRARRRARRRRRPGRAGGPCRRPDGPIRAVAERAGRTSAEIASRLIEKAELRSSACPTRR